MLLYLNLLPKEEREKIKFEYAYRVLKKEAIFIVVLLMFISGTGFYVQKDLERKLHIIEKAVEENKSQNKPFVSDIQKLNQGVHELETIQNWPGIQEEMLIYFVQLVPSGIQLTSVFLDINQTISIKGRYESRDQLIVFKEYLEEKFLSKIDFPIANLLQEKNGDFTVNGTISKEVMEELAY